MIKLSAHFPFDSSPAFLQGGGGSISYNVDCFIDSQETAQLQITNQAKHAPGRYTNSDPFPRIELT